MRYYAHHTLADVKVLEELLIKTPRTFSRLFLFGQRKPSSHTGTPRKPSVTVPRRYSEHLCQRPSLSLTPRDYVVQLGNSYQTLQDICSSSSTDADIRKVLADRSTKSTSLREARGSNSNLRSRASALIAHLLLYFCCYQSSFLKATKGNHQFAEMGYRPWDSGKFIKATHLRTCTKIYK